MFILLVSSFVIVYYYYCFIFITICLFYFYLFHIYYYYYYHVLQYAINKSSGSYAVTDLCFIM
jgi:hypothetical protein